MRIGATPCAANAWKVIFDVRSQQAASAEKPAGYGHAYSSWRFDLRFRQKVQPRESPGLTREEMAMDENITKAQQCVELLKSDISAAFHESCRCDAPQGPSRRDHALRMVLADLLADVRKLQARLLDLGE